MRHNGGHWHSSEPCEFHSPPDATVSVIEGLDVPATAGGAADARCSKPVNCA